jgi:alpha/beta superfamily hydrolase
VPHNETFDIAGPAGRLEAILMHPEGAPRAAAVLCHAHPLHGGVMHFKVLFRAAKALQAHGAAVLRFNFRGVGRSEGSHDEGRGEQDDTRAAIAEVRRRFPALPLVLGGFSFGAHMALRVACGGGAPVRALLVLGFPLKSAGDTAFVASCPPVPKLFVHGENDVFASGDQIRALAAGVPPPAPVEVIGGADHFFTHHLDEMQSAVDRWAATRPWEER